MRVSDLIVELQKYPPDYCARAYEGEVNGIIVEDTDCNIAGVIKAHESDEYHMALHRRRYPRK